jgi:hypothetical protein
MCLAAFATAAQRAKSKSLVITLVVGQATAEQFLSFPGLIISTVLY